MAFERLKTPGFFKLQLCELGFGAATLAANLQKPDRAALVNGDGGRVPDDIQNLGVNADVQVVLLRKLSVALVTLVPNEVADAFSEHGVADIDHPLSWHERDVLVIRHVRPDPPPVKLERKEQDLLHAEALVLRSVQVLDLGGLDGFSHAGDDLLHEVDVDALERRQVQTGVDGEKAK
jgi:hypothetical protein